MAAPWEAPRLVGQQRVDDQRFFDPPLHEHAIVTVEQHLHRVVGIAQGRRKGPHRKRLASPALQSRQCELQLHTALGADQLVPLIDDDHRQIGQLLTTLGARKHQAQRFGRADQDLGQLLRLLRTLARIGVSRAHPDAPREAEVVERRSERTRSVGCQCTHRGQPQQAQAPGEHFAGKRAIEQGEPDRVRLAGSGGRVQQPRTALGNMPPHLALKFERLPAVRCKPAFGTR